jgi:transposase-like protein
MDKSGKRVFVRRTEQQKLDLIDQWEKSGLPIKTFSEQHKFSDSIFHSWLNKYRRNKKTLPAERSFLPLHLSQSAVVSTDVPPYAEIITANGNQVKLFQPVTVDFLRKLLS